MTISELNSIKEKEIKNIDDVIFIISEMFISMSTQQKKNTEALLIINKKLEKIEEKIALNKIETPLYRAIAEIENRED